MRRLLCPLVLGVVALSAAAPARAVDTVTYLDGGEVYNVAVTGGTPAKVTDGSLRDYNAIAQADNGRLVAVRNAPGSKASLSTYVLWGPSGQVLRAGLLPSQPGWFIYAYPIGIDLAGDGTWLAYGYSNAQLFPAGGEVGTYLVNPENGTPSPPHRLVGEQQPSFVGSRLVTSSESVIRLQKPTAAPPDDQFDPWIPFVTSDEISGVETNAAGSVLLVGLSTWVDSTVTNKRVLAMKTPGPGGSPTAECWLPATGMVEEADVSPDGTRVAWIDAAGVRVAGAPTFDGADPCTLSSPPVTVGPASARDVVLGPFALPAAPPTGGGQAPPTPSAPAAPGTPSGPVPGRVTTRKLAVRVGSTKASTLAKGWKLTVTSPVAGSARASLKVARKTVATGRAKVKADRGTRLTLRATKAARRTLRSLKRKKATLTVTVAGRTTTKKLTLR